MNRSDIPTTLDDANVLSVTLAAGNFGLVGTLDCGDVKIVALAIAQYEDDPGIYLFACDSTWNVVGDLLYDSCERAKRDGERYYETGPLEWTDTTANQASDATSQHAQGADSSSHQG